jgi:DNA-directed RNA polymerase subunit M/transcription elongation factor TFIIS
MERPDYIPRFDFDEVQYDQTVDSGIAAIKGGDREEARRLLFKATEMKPGDPNPWIWLSATTDDPKEQREYLEYALAADPSNGAAKRGLVLLSDKLDHSRLMEEGESVQPRNTDEPEEAQIEATFMCPKCGSYLLYDPEKTTLNCQHCGYQQALSKEAVAEKNEQVLDYVLPTTRGHRWAESQHRVSCSQCGAVTIIPAGEKTAHCPYCGSDQLIESAESIELVDPQVIVLPKFKADKASLFLKEWLGKGMFIPDDLKKLARPTALLPAFYPFWTFDGTCHMNWSCEINAGTDQAPNWVMRDGVVFEMFDDEVVAGLSALEDEHWTELKPINIKEGVQFEPVYLAGWRMLAYNLPLAEASLQAREKVARRLRRDLHNRVQISMQKRKLHAGRVDWSGMTFKHVLFPLWVGTYHYRGKDFRVLINGQTGKVCGQKPFDRVKTYSFAAMVLAAILVLLVSLLLLALQMGWIIL